MDFEIEALINLIGTDCVLKGTQIISPEGIERPSDEAIQTEASRLQADYDSKQYQRDRQPEYPSLADLADALYWSNQGDNTKLDEYYAACAAVKAKYPKP